MCLDHSAHGLVSTHEIFQLPYKIDLVFDEVPTPEHYRKFYNGRKLGKTMKAWRVQKTGYVKDRSMPAGVVAGGWGFADAPDGEFISGGFNTKGPRYVALGRHGPFFQWGFSAAPSQMTKSGRRAFVNAICYISKFDGQQPLTRKQPRSSHRGYDLDRALSLGKLDEGYKSILDSHQKRKAAYENAMKIKESKSRPLTEQEQFALKYPVRDPITWDAYKAMFLRGYPKEVVARFGTDKEGLKKYFAWSLENIEYFMRGKGGSGIDEDAKALGISNRSVAILDKAVVLLASKDAAERARGQRLLSRYTDQKFGTGAQWSEWLEREREFLFFSDVDGFRFHTSRRSLQGQRQELQKGSGAPEPTGKQPVTMKLSIRGEARPGATVTLVLGMKILDGWHIYAQVPQDSPYPVTKLDLVLPKGATAIGNWDRPTDTPTADDPATTHYVGTALFLREIRLAKEFVPGTKLTLDLSWQACDEFQCLPPDERKLELGLGSKPAARLR